MTGPLPPLSELLSWSTGHLTAGADDWDALASRWEASFEAVGRHVLTSDWEGVASSSLLERTYWDRVRVTAPAGDLRHGAEIAHRGASDVTAARNRLREVVGAARNIGFDVDDRYALTDRMSTVTFAQEIRRRAEAYSLAQDIHRLAAGLVDTDQHVGGRLAKAIAHLDDNTFEDEGPSTGATETGEVQLVDMVTPKESPILGPGEPAGVDGGPSAPDTRAVLEKLPEGNRPWIREVRTPADLQRLWKWLEQNGIDNPSRYGDPSRGVWKDLPDGSGVGKRPSAGSTRLPAIDINLSGSEH